MKMKLTAYPVLLILILFSNRTSSQEAGDTLRNNLTDTLPVSADSAKLKADTLAAGNHPAVKSYGSVVNELLSSNKFINVKEPAVFFIAARKQRQGKEFVFYTLCAIVLILGLFKTFYGSYFNNLFRVFFNTSLRQNQLTDLLLQAKLPSLIFNLFFNFHDGCEADTLFHYNLHINEFLGKYQMGSKLTAFDINSNMLVTCQAASIQVYKLNELL